jgi:hypothetical protein
MDIYGTFLQMFPSTQFREHLGGQLHVLGLMLAPAPMPLGGVFSWKRNPAVTTMRDDTMIPWLCRSTLNHELFCSSKYLRLELTWNTISIHISHHIWWQRPPPAAQTPKMCSMSATAWAGPQFRHPAASGRVRQPDEVKGLTMPWPSFVFFFKDTRRDSHVLQSFWWNEPIIPGGYPPPNLSLFSLPPRFWNEHGNTIVFTF